MRRLVVSLTVTLAFALFSSTVVRAHDQPGSAPAFSPDDEVRVARALCGPVKRGSVPRISDKVDGFLNAVGDTLFEPLLSKTYVVQGTARHVYVLGGHDVLEGEVVSSHATSTTVLVALLEAKAGKWTVVAKNTELTEGGSNGYAPDVTLRQIGAARHAIDVGSGWVGMGYSMSSTSLFELAPTFPKLLQTGLDGSDCGVDEKKCFSFEGTLAADAGSGVDPYDLKVTLKGTYRNEKKKVVPVPSTPIVLRYKDGKYDLLAPSAAVKAAWWGINNTGG